MTMKEWSFLLGFVALALFLTISSWDYPFISALYPRMLLISGFVLCGIKVVRMLGNKQQKVKEQVGDEENLRYPERMWVYLGSGVLYMVLMPVLGFILSSLVTLTILFGLYRINLKTNLGVSIGTALALHYIFVVALDIPLPKGVLERLFF
jgi:hypothetical protein